MGSSGYGSGDGADYYAGSGSYDRETVRFFDVAHEGGQVRAVASIAGELGGLRGLTPRSLVVVGTDQVSRAAARAAVKLRDPLPLPVVVTATLPDYVGPLDVILVVGSCADDERTGRDSRALLTAAARGAETILAGPARGAILEDAPAGVVKAPTLPTADGASPLRAMALVWALLDALVQPPEIVGEFLTALADEVDSELEALSPQRDESVNAARQLRAFAEGTHVLHTGFTPSGDAVAALAAELWATRGLASGYVARAELGPALEDVSAAARDPFHDPFLPSLADGPQLVPLKTVVWDGEDSPEAFPLPNSRVESADSSSRGVLGAVSMAARLSVRAYAATAMNAPGF